MKCVGLYGQVRRAVYVEGLSRREAARRFGIDPGTVAKMLAFSVPPGYQRHRPPGDPECFNGRYPHERRLSPDVRNHQRIRSD